MGFVLKRDEGMTDFQPAPSGAHAARLIKVVDLGTQRTVFNGVESFKPQIFMQWELVDCPMESGDPFVIGQRFTRSMHEKASLRRMLEGWRGKKFTDAELDSGFSLSMLLGKPCMVNVTHVEKNGKTFANIGSVMAAPGGLPVKPAKNATVDLTLDEDFDINEFNKLSQKMQEIVAGSPEYKNLGKPVEYEAPPEDDDIPF